MLPYRVPPLPLVAVALLLALWVFNASSGNLSGGQCDSDLEELLGDIERNRITTIEEINRQLEDDDIDPSGLVRMREQAWDREEQQRGQANYIWRDCMQAAGQ